MPVNALELPSVPDIPLLMQEINIKCFSHFVGLVPEAQMKERVTGFVVVFTVKALAHTCMDSRPVLKQAHFDHLDACPVHTYALLCSHTYIHIQCSVPWGCSNQHINKSPVLQCLSPDESSEATGCRGKPQACCSNCHIKGIRYPTGYCCQSNGWGRLRCSWVVSLLW